MTVLDKITPLKPVSTTQAMYTSCYEEFETGLVNRHGLVNVEEPVRINPNAAIMLNP